MVGDLLNSKFMPVQNLFFRTRPDLLWGPHIFLYNEYRVSVPGVKHPTRGTNHPPPSSAEVKERVQLYFYSTLVFHGLFEGEIYLFFVSYV
jgi:hypothetical protein